MSKVLCEKSDLVAIADSVRNKTGTTGGMKVSEIPQKIEAIETGSNVNLQEKAITITSNGTTTVTPDTGYDALDKVDVTVNVSGGGGSSSETWVLNDEAYLFNNEATTFSANFTSNGLSFSSIMLSLNLRRQILYDSTVVKGLDAWTSQAYRKLTFDAPPTGDLLTWLQANGVKQANNTVMQPEKTLTITSNGTITITPDVPYDALKKINVSTNVSSSPGFSVTFPSTVGDSDSGKSPSIFLYKANGTTLQIFSASGTEYSNVAGKTIEGVIGIFYENNSNFHKLKLALTGSVYVTSLTSGVGITTNGTTPATFVNPPIPTLFLFLSDSTITNMEIYNVD